MAVTVSRSLAHTGGKLRGVEAARGFAASLVVLSHATKLLAAPKDFGTMPFAGVFAAGSAGVDFFFVLSGFIILHVHARDIGEPAAWPAYAWRRFSRVFPIYWAVLLAYGLLLAISPSRDLYERDPVAIVTSLLLIPRAGHDPILGVAWTLQHEILFYSVFGLLLLRAAVGRVVLGAWLGLIVLNGATGVFDRFPGGFLFGAYNAEFFFGMAVALLVRRRSAWPPWVALAAGVALFLGTGIAQGAWPGLGPDAGSLWITLRLSYATGAALILYGVVLLERQARWWQVPGWAVTLGSASYSVYLLHVIVLMVLIQGVRLWRRFLPLPEEPAFVILVVATIVVAVAFSRVVEQPLLQVCRSLGRRRVHRPATIP